MNKLTEHLEKDVADMLYYYREESVPAIIKTVFETILKAERNDFLKEQPASQGNKANGFYSRLVRGVTKFFHLRVPRDRLGLFKPVFLDAIKEQDRQVSDLALTLYTKGLTTRDIKQVFEDVYGKGISPSSISNITKDFEAERLAWQARPLEPEYYFIYLDALWVPVRRGTTVAREAFYVALGLRTDLKRDILGVYNLPQESAEGWREVIQDLKCRGIEKCLMIIADGITGLETVVHEELPDTKLQKCIFHKKKNVLTHVRNSDKPFVAQDLAEVFVVDDKHYTPADGKRALAKFLTKWSPKYPSLKAKFADGHLDYYFSYLAFPYKIQRMLYTTNWIERLIKAVRKTQRSRNAFPNPTSALNLIGAYVMDYERTTYQFGVPTFLPVKDVLDDMLESSFAVQTHKD